MKRFIALFIVILVFVLTGCGSKEKLIITDNDTPLSVQQLALPAYDPEYTFVNSFDGRYVCFAVARPVTQQTPNGVAMETSHVIVYDTETQQVEKQLT